MMQAAGGLHVAGSRLDSLVTEYPEIAAELAKSRAKGGNGRLIAAYIKAVRVMRELDACLKDHGDLMDAAPTE